MSTGMEDTRPEVREPSSPPSGGLDRFKEFGPTSFAVDHTTSVKVLLALLTVMGLYSYFTTPRESFPEIELPMIGVSVVYPGVSPGDMETLVTRPLEDELTTISDLKELTSTSTEGLASVVAEFETTVDLNEALQRVREKVDLARPDLPQDAEDPVISEFNFSEVPVLQVNLSGPYGLVRLKEVAEDLQDRLETIPQVLRVDLRGGLEREVQVDVDLQRLKYYGLALQDVVDAVSTENVNIPGGSIDVGAAKYLVRVDGEFDDPAVIEELVVTTVNDRPIYVRDVATVDFGFAERESFARLDGEDVVTLDVIKRSGRNIIQTSEGVKAAISEMQPTFPAGTVATLTSDQSEDIRMMVSSLENNIVSGLILIVGVLFFFLGLTNSFFVGISIPASMLLSFIILKAMGLTMNMVVLFSLILALGMLVDNAIVVVENIYRYMEEGWDRTAAAKKATGEVAMPVIAATLTTLAAFAPLIFWPGMTGEFMSFLPKTLIVTLSSSLFVALVIIPALCSQYMRLESEPRKGLKPAARWSLIALGLVALAVVMASNILTALLLLITVVILAFFFRTVLGRLGTVFQERLVPASIRLYERQLRWALDHRAVIVGGTGAAFVVSFLLFAQFNSGIEFFPEDIPPKQVFVDVETPVGTRADATDRIVRRLEAELAQVPGRTDWESSVAASGSAGGNAISGAMGQGGPSGPDRGRISMTYVDFQDQEFDAFETLAWMQANIGTEIAGAEVRVEKRQEGVNTGPAVNVEIVGEDPAVLKALADRAIQILQADPVYTRMVGLESDMNAARPELAVTVDRERAALYGLSTLDVGQAVRGAIQGIEAAKYRDGNDEFDIVVRLAPEYRRELDQLADLTVVTEGGRQIPISSVATWNVGEGYGSIQRKDEARVATVSASPAAGVNANALLAEAREALTDFQDELPPGYTVKYTGQQEDQAEAQAFLSTAFLVALFLIGFILVSQFNSVVKPVIILTSVLMSTVGVFLGLLLFRMPFGIIMTGVGIISLAGIVVNNAIVLIDYIDILRDRDGMDRREALVHGGKTRFRPVVLTATTTALGLVPLAVGLNFDFFGLYSSLSPELYWGGEQAAWWGPMAVAVIAGIVFATFLTLVLVPVLYSLVDDASGFLLRHFTHAGDASPGEVSSEARGEGGGPRAPTGGDGGSAPAGGSPAQPGRGRRKPEPAGTYRNTLTGLAGPELQPE
jgi:multidrug efflux pump subunit AcrB